MSHRRIDDGDVGECGHDDPPTEGNELYETGRGSYILVSGDRPSTQWIETTLVVDLEP